MDISKLVKKIKQHSEYGRVGMILCHNGVVRATSRNGRKVSGLKVSVDNQILQKVIEKQKNKPGIIEILVEIDKDRMLLVGDDIMLVVVAGDIRDNVIPVLTDIINAIKTDVTNKTEFYE